MLTLLLLCVLASSSVAEEPLNQDPQYLEYVLKSQFGGLTFDEATLPDHAQELSQESPDAIPPHMVLAQVEAFSNGLKFDENELEDEHNEQSENHHPDEIPPSMVIRHVEAFSNGLKFDESKLPQQDVDAEEPTIYIDINGLLYQDNL